MYVVRFSSFRLVGAVNHHLGVAVRLVRFGSALFELSCRIMGISARLEYAFGFWSVLGGSRWVCGYVASRRKSPP